MRDPIIYVRAGKGELREKEFRDERDACIRLLRISCLIIEKIWRKENQATTGKIERNIFFRFLIGVAATYFPANARGF